MIYFFSSNAEKLFNEAQYPKDEDIYLISGRESTGRGEKTSNKYRDRIPLNKNQCSLNLSSSADGAVYEVLRQLNFTGVV